MKERPILFSAPMVNAILQGRKTQTRRALRKQPDDCSDRHKMFTEADWRNEPPSFVENSTDPGFWYCKYCGNGTGYDNEFYGIKCPYGKPGDRLWLRETHYKQGIWYKNGKTKTGKQKWSFKPTSDAVLYEDSKPILFEKSRNKDYPEKVMWYKRLGRFMPRSASRITLEIKNIRVERLQDISEEDAIAEGGEERYHRCNGFGYYESGGEILDCICQRWEESPAVMGYKDLWEFINGEGSWQINPWVWVIEFTKL